ncbi:MAG: hypothetical protein Q8K30_06035 [Candidatus Gracilibacteria bacterium]|nr:hypothetical protein [Candidatus Gracilibacteria bacterium]MDP2395808.1 hypothetical protein [bacterium]MDP3380585.1 hypothetical protein [bacterium]
MTTITIESDLKLSKTNFSDMYELYYYIEEKYILPDLQFKSINDLSFEEKLEFEKAKSDNSKLINI